VYLQGIVSQAGAIDAALYQEYVAYPADSGLTN
jgi:hypothetical protein